MNSSDKRWPGFKSVQFHNIEREIYNLQARLMCDADERADIERRIDELKAELAAVKWRMSSEPSR